MRHRERIVGVEEADTTVLDRVFDAIADPVRRAILRRLDGAELLVSELAEPFDISLQAVSRHIQVLVRAGLVTQERIGRVSRCRLAAEPILSAAIWLNHYSRYWQEPSSSLPVWLPEGDRAKPESNVKSAPVSRRIGARPRPL